MLLSHRCQTCRDAKVRCDLRYPICKRCERLKLKCEHVREADVFRNENQVAAKNVYLRQQSSAQKEKTAIIRNPQFDVNTQAINDFLANYVLHPCNHEFSPGYLESLPTMLAASRDGDLLSTSVSATSLAYHAVGVEDPVLKERAHKMYAKALRALSAATRDSSFTDESTLMALLILEFFDIFLGYESRPVGPHSQILASVLQKRGVAQLSNPLGQGLFRVAWQRILLLEASQKSVPGDQSRLQSVVSLLDQLDINLPTTMAQQNHRIVSLGRRASGLLQSLDIKEDPVTEIQVIIDEVSDIRQIEESLDARFDRWLRPRRVSRSGDAPRPEAAVVEDDIIVYHDLWLAKEWTIHSAFLLSTFDSVADLLEHSIVSTTLAISEKGHMEEQLSNVVAQMANLTDMIMSSMPMLSGTVNEYECYYAEPRGKTIGGFFLLFPLQTIVNARHLGEDQVLRGRVALKVMENRMRGRALMSKEIETLLSDLRFYHQLHTAG